MSLAKSNFLEFWGLRLSPFSHVQHKPDELFLPESWQICLRKLRLTETNFLHLIKVPDGHAKSTLSLWLQQQVHSHTSELFLLQIHHQQTQHGWLFRNLYPFIYPNQLRPAQDFERQLLVELAKGNQALTLLIDDADKLQNEESLNDIANLLSSSSLIKVRIQVVLLGNQSTEDLVKTHPKLSHKVLPSIEIYPFDAEQTHSYLEQKIRCAGASLSQMFTDEVIQTLHEHSGGIVSKINILAECLLQKGFEEQISLIDKQYALTQFSRGSIQTQTSSGSDSENPKKTKSSREISLKSLFYEVDGDSSNTAV